MSISLYVQLIRNFLCVWKTFLPTTSSFRLLAFPTASSPLNAVNCIEFFIALTQGSAVILNFISCYINIIKGLGEVFRTNRLKASLDQLSVFGASQSSVEYTLLRHSLEDGHSKGYHNIRVGIAEFFLGGVFAFLAANSLHIHGPSHPLPLIQALIVMEIALVYFLYSMIKQMIFDMSTYRRLQLLRNMIESNHMKVQDKNKDEKSKDKTKEKDHTDSNKKIGNRRVLLSATECGFVHNLMVPFQHIIAPSFAFKSYNMMPSAHQAQVLRNDLRDIHNLLLSSDDQNTHVNTSMITTTSSLSEVLNRIDRYSQECVFDLSLTMVCFVLNGLAGYGYLLGILAYYYPKASLDSNNVIEMVVKMLMWNMSASTAEYVGNLVGDVAWTIEPVVVLLVPLVKDVMFPTPTLSTTTSVQTKKDN